MSEIQRGRPGYRKHSAQPRCLAKHDPHLRSAFPFHGRLVWSCAGWAIMKDEMLPATWKGNFRLPSCQRGGVRWKEGSWVSGMSACLGLENSLKRSGRNNLPVIHKSTSVPETALGKQCSRGFVRRWVVGREPKTDFLPFSSLLLTTARTNFPGEPQVRHGYSIN